MLRRVVEKYALPDFARSRPGVESRAVPTIYPRLRDRGLRWSMRLVTFNPYRTLDMADVTYIKPELMFRQRDLLCTADWLLFPEYWQVNALTYGLRRPVFPSPATYHLGHDKVEMTRGFWSLVPQHVPETRILAASEAAVEEVLDSFTFPFVVKEPRNAMGRGVFLMETRADFLRFAADHPVLYVQEYLPLQRDLRVVYIGDQVVSAYWRRGVCDFRNNVALGGEISFDDVPEAPLRLVEQVARGLGIDHAGFDVAEVNGHWYLLEFNVLFGNQALVMQGVRLGPLIVQHLEKRGEHPRDPDRPLWPVAC